MGEELKKPITYYLSPITEKEEGKKMFSKLRKKGLVPGGLAVFLLASVIAYAVELTGEEVLERIKGKAAVTRSGEATVNLITINKKGEQKEYKIKIYRKVTDKMEKQLIEYLEPADVEGTKFLSIAEEGKEDLMYLYLPFLGRERRIAAQEKSKKFMGTDFTYEEIGSSEGYREDYTAQRLKDDNFQDYPCYLLKLSPKEKKDVRYSYLKMWVWKEEYFPLKIEFYRSDEKLEKVLTEYDLRKEKEDYIPYKIVMADKINSTRTIIEILETKEEEVSDDYFTLRYLRR